MPPVAVVTLVLAALLVVALAFYLTWVILILRSVDDTLGKVTFGVRAIAHRVEPLDLVLSEVNADLGDIAHAFEDVAEATGQRPARAR